MLLTIALLLTIGRLLTIALCPCAAVTRIALLCVLYRGADAAPLAGIVAESVAGLLVFTGGVLDFAGKFFCCVLKL